MHDSDGLFLERTASGGRWLFRYSHLGERRDMGLGSYPEVSLSQARQERDKWRSELRKGNDPIGLRREMQEAAKQDQDDPTFEELTHIVLAALHPTLRGGGSRGRWLSPFTSPPLPKLGETRLSKLTRSNVADALRPIWRTKHPTAIKATNRTRRVLKEAAMMGYEVDPVIVDQAIRMLGAVQHVATPIAATPWQDVPALYQRLPATSAGQCCRFLLLTLVRFHAGAGLRLGEVDLDAEV